MIKHIHALPHIVYQHAILRDLRINHKTIGEHIDDGESHRGDSNHQEQKATKLCLIVLLPIEIKLDIRAEEIELTK